MFFPSVRINEGQDHGINCMLNQNQKEGSFSCLEYFQLPPASFSSLEKKANVAHTINIRRPLNHSVKREGGETKKHAGGARVVCADVIQPAFSLSAHAQERNVFVAEPRSQGVGWAAKGKSSGDDEAFKSLRLKSRPGW